MPTDIISQKLQIQGPLKQKAYKNAMDVIVKTYQLEGLKGFYRGILFFVNFFLVLVIKLFIVYRLQLILKSKSCL